MNTNQPNKSTAEQVAISMLARLPADAYLRALKGALGLTNAQIAKRAGDIDEYTVAAALKHPDPAGRVEEVLSELAVEAFGGPDGES